MSDTYVYGVIRGDGVPRRREGIDGARPRLVRHGPLAAVVGDPKTVPIRPSRRNLLAHTEVLRSAMDVSPVLPMRFGVVLPGDAAVVGELLEPARAELGRLLDELEGRVELELKVIYEEDELLRDIVQRDPRLSELRARLRRGAGYHERLAAGESIAGAIEARRRAEEARIVADLSVYAERVTPPSQPPPSVLTKVSFLVASTRAAEFEHAVERLARERAPLFRFLLHGPLPPFSFVDLALPVGAAA